MKEIYLFRHIVHPRKFYCWNGLYPIKLLGPDGDLWDENGVITDQEVKILDSMLGTRKKSFELKGKGKFEITHRIKTEL